jgi:hypothetical protein
VEEEKGGGGEGEEGCVRTLAAVVVCEWLEQRIAVEGRVVREGGGRGRGEGGGVRGGGGRGGGGGWANPRAGR